MKKIYLVRHKTFFSSENISWGSCALLFAVILLFVRLLVPNIFWQIFAPVFSISDTLASQSRSIMSGFKNAEILTLKNDQLIQEKAVLGSENQMLLQKVANISALFDSSATKKNTSKILAGVVARPPESPYDTLVLAAGTNNGVTIGMEAFGAGGVPIGVVSSVLDDFSRVTLFSMPSMVTSGWIGNSAIPVTIFGSGAGVMNITIARSANIVVGDTIFVPGPGMLPVGKVVRIDNDLSSPSVKLHIAPITNLFSIAWVVLSNTGAVFSLLP
ncbi:MAG: rod shape-determining protein MreC [bacterium]